MDTAPRVAVGQLWHQFVRSGVMRSVRVVAVEGEMAEVLTWLPDNDGTLPEPRPTHVSTFRGLRLIESAPGVPA